MVGFLLFLYSEQSGKKENTLSSPTHALSSLLYSCEGQTRIFYEYFQLRIRTGRNKKINFLLIWDCLKNINSICEILFEFLKNFSFFLLIIIRFSLLAEMWWSVCMSNSHGSLYGLFSWTGAGLCIYHLLVWSNLNFLHISQSSLVFYPLLLLLLLLLLLS